jgi:hypothetical protein
MLTFWKFSGTWFVAYNFITWLPDIALAKVLNNHLSAASERGRLLAVYSAVLDSKRQIGNGYFLRTRPQYHPKVIAKGSFGKVYKGSELNICVKIADFSKMNAGLLEVCLRIFSVLYSTEQTL